MGPCSIDSNSCPEPKSPVSGVWRRLFMVCAQDSRGTTMRRFRANSARGAILVLVLLVLELVGAHELNEVGPHLDSDAEEQRARQLGEGQEGLVLAWPTRGLTVDGSHILNVGDGLRLRASKETEAAGGEWSVSRDGEAVDLQDSKYGGLVSTRPSELSVFPGFWSHGSSYLISVSPYASRASQVSIAVNSPPVPGSFDVHLEASVMPLLHRLTADGWTDPEGNLPLTYTYSCLRPAEDGSAAGILLRAPSPLSTVLTPLPPSAARGALQVAVEVADTYGAVSEQATDVLMESRHDSDLLGTLDQYLQGQPPMSYFDGKWELEEYHPADAALVVLLGLGGGEGLGREVSEHPRVAFLLDALVASMGPATPLARTSSVARALRQLGQYKERNGLRVLQQLAKTVVASSEPLGERRAAAAQAIVGAVSQLVEDGAVGCGGPGGEQSRARDMVHLMAHKTAVDLLPGQPAISVTAPQLGFAVESRTLDHKAEEEDDMMSFSLGHNASLYLPRFHHHDSRWGAATLEAVWWLDGSLDCQGGQQVARAPHSSSSLSYSIKVAVDGGAKPYDGPVGFMLPSDVGTEGEGVQDTEGRSHEETVECPYPGALVNVLCGTSEGGGAEAEMGIVCPPGASRVAVTCPLVASCMFQAEGGEAWSSEGCSPWTDAGAEGRVGCACSMLRASAGGHLRVAVARSRVLSVTDKTEAASDEATDQAADAGGEGEDAYVTTSVILAGLYAALATTLMGAWVLSLRRLGKESYHIETCRESQLYKDVMRHLRQVTAVRSKATPGSLSPNPVKQQDTWGSNRSGSDSTDSSPSPMVSPGSKKLVFFPSDEPAKEKKPDLSNVMRSVLSDKFKRLDELVMLRPPASAAASDSKWDTKLNLSKSLSMGDESGNSDGSMRRMGAEAQGLVPSYMCTLGAGRVSSLSFTSGILNLFVQLLTILLVSLALPGPALSISIRRHHFAVRVDYGGSVAYLLWGIAALSLRSVIMVFVGKLSYWCLLELERQVAKTCALQDWILERDIRFQDPKAHLHKDRIYTSALQVATAQLRLVQQVLQSDYAAAVRDFKASKVATEPDHSELTLIERELQAYSSRLTEIRKEFQDQRKGRLLKQLTTTCTNSDRVELWAHYWRDRVLGPRITAKNPLEHFDEQARVTNAFDQWALSVLHANPSRGWLQKAYFSTCVAQDMVAEPLSVPLPRCYRTPVSTGRITISPLSLCLYGVVVAYAAVVTPHVCQLARGSDSPTAQVLALSFVGTAILQVLVVAPLMAVLDAFINDSVVRSIKADIQLALPTFVSSMLSIDLPGSEAGAVPQSPRRGNGSATAQLRVRSDVDPGLTILDDALTKSLNMSLRRADRFFSDLNEQEESPQRASKAAYIWGSPYPPTCRRTGTGPTGDVAGSSGNKSKVTPSMAEPAPATATIFSTTAPAVMNVPPEPERQPVSAGRLPVFSMTAPAALDLPTAPSKPIPGPLKTGGSVLTPRSAPPSATAAGLSHALPMQYAEAGGSSADLDSSLDSNGAVVTEEDEKKGRGRRLGIRRRRSGEEGAGRKGGL